ncbi:MAG: glycosyltransferase family 8 protein [Nanoarchaeota archaeon]
MQITKGEINVGTIADENYSQHTGVWMFSILKNSDNPSKIHFHIFDGGINEKSKNLMRLVCKRFNSKIDFIIPEYTLFEGLKLGTHLPPVIYCKLIFPDKLKKINKIIILDSDIIVEGDITELFNISLEGKTLGAVPDAGIDTQEISKRKLGLNKDKEYFNSGVMLIDCNRWREKRIFKRVIGFIKKNPEKITVQDQDGLNFVLQKDWKELPYEWNVTHPFYYNSTGLKNKLGKEKFKEIISKPKIIHYTIKPWVFEKVHPLRERYWYYLKQTPWKNRTYQDKTPKNFLLKGFRLLIRPLSWETKIKIKNLFYNIKPKKESSNFYYVSQK